MAKERVSLTLDSDILQRIDQRLEREGIDNRSRGIEQLLEDYLKNASVTTAVILAGGEDPNCTIKINGRPIIAHILDHLEEAGVETVYIATNDHELQDAVDGHALAPVFLVEEEPLGTAGCLRQLQGEVDDAFLVMNGDVLCKVDIDDMKAAHEESDGLATIALTTVRDSAEYGVIRMKRNKVVGFEEKPEESFSHLVNAGIYLLDPDILDRLPDEDEQRVVDLEDVFETLAGEGLLSGYVHDGEWREVG